MTVDTAELRRLLNEANLPWSASTGYGSNATKGYILRERLAREAVNALPDLLDRIEELEAVAEAARVLSDVDLNYRGDLDHQRLQDALADLREALARLDREEK